MWPERTGTEANEVNRMRVEMALEFRDESDVSRPVQPGVPRA